MSYERTDRAFDTAAASHSFVPSVGVLNAGGIPVTVIALALSAAVHGGLLAGAYFLPWSQEPISSAALRFTKGDRAIQVVLVSSRWPDTPPVPVVSPVVPALHEQPNPVSTTIEETAPSVWPGEGASDAESSYETATASSHVYESLPVVTAQSGSSRPDYSPPDSDVPFVSAPKTECDEETTPSLVEPWQRSINSNEATIDRPNRKAKFAISQVADDVPTDTTLGTETGVAVMRLPRPKYPLASFRRGEAGLVMLEVEVLPDGSVGRIKVVRDAGFPRLSAAAIAAVREAVFRPAMRRGMAVKDIVRIPFRFVLK